LKIIFLFLFCRYGGAASKGPAEFDIVGEVDTECHQQRNRDQRDGSEGELLLCDTRLHKGIQLPH